MKTSQFLVILVVLLLVVNAVTLTVFWMDRGQNSGGARGFMPPPPHPKGHAEHNRVSVEMILKEDIGFSKDQMNEFRKLRQDHHNKVEVILPDLRASKENYMQLASSDNTNTESERMNEILKNHQLLDEITLSHIRDLRKLCDEGQMSDFDANIERVARVIAGPPPHKPPHR